MGCNEPTRVSDPSPIQPKSQDQVADALMASFSDHRAMLFTIARGYVGSDLATDVVQEVITRAWRDRIRFDSTKGSWRTYLVVLTRGVAIDALRQSSSRQRRERRDLATRVDTGADELLDLVRNEEGLRLSIALDALSKVERELVTDAFYGTETYQQIADRLGLPVGTVKSRIRGALRKLRHALVDLRNDETQASAKTLQRPLSARAAIEQTRGVVMETDGSDAGSALDVIVGRSITEDRELIELAADVISNAPTGLLSAIGHPS